MEIIEFLNLTVRRVASLVALGLLVALPTTAILLRGPAEYRGTVTVRLSALLPEGGAFFLWERLTQDFQTALELPEVADEVGRKTGADPNDVRSGLRTVLPSDGDVVTVSYTGRDATRSLAVARVASAEALNVLTAQGVAETDARVNAADHAFEAALQDFQRYVASSNPPDPVASANGTLTVLLNVKRDAVTSGGSPTANAQIARLERQLNALVAVAPQYRQVIETAETARGAARQATFDQVVAASQNATAASAALVTPTGSAPVSRTTSVLTTGMGVGAAAVMAVLAALAAIELRRGRRIDQLAVVLYPESETGTDQRAVWRSYRRLTLSSIGARLTQIPPRMLRRGWWLLAPIGFIVSLGEAALLSSSKTVLAVVVAIPLGLGLTVLAVTRFEAFLLTLIVVRASLDAFNVTSPDGGTTGVDPGIMIGGVFTVCAAMWLLAQRRSGYWIKVSPATWALWSFAGACLLSVPTSFAVAGSLLTTLKVVAGVLMFSVLEQYLGRRPERARILLMTMFASFVVPALAGLKQWVSGEGNTYLVEVSRVTGTFVTPPTFAVYLLLLLPLSVLLVGWYRGRNRVVMLTILAVVAGLLILTYTRSAWFAALTSISYLAVRWRREVLFALVAGVAVLLITVPSVTSRFADLNAPPPAAGVPSNSLSWRIGYWQRLVPKAAVNPVTGLGFDAVEHTEPERLQPHNVFVQAYVETGVIGLASVLAIIGTMSKMLRDRLRNAAQGWPRLLALGAVGAAIAILLEFPGENLLSQTFVYWYLAVAMTYGIGTYARDRVAVLA